MERLRAECPVSRPMEGFVYTSTLRRHRGDVQGREAVLVGRGFPRRGRGRSRRGELPRRDRPAAAPARPSPAAPRVHAAHRARGGAVRRASSPSELLGADRRQRRRRPDGRAVHRAARLRCRPRRSASPTSSTTRSRTGARSCCTARGRRRTRPSAASGIGGGFPEFAEIIDDADRRLRRESADPPDDLLTRMVQARGRR